MRKVFVFVFFAIMMALVARSGLYIFRVYREFDSVEVDYKPYINPCEKLHSKDYEDLRLYNYRKIGIKCEK